MKVVPTAARKACGTTKVVSRHKKKRLKGGQSESQSGGKKGENR